MASFEQNITSLINELNPNNINLSRDIYDFKKIETANIKQLPYFLKVGKLNTSTLVFPALVPFIDSKGMVYVYNHTEEDFAKQYLQNLVFDLIGKISPNQIDIFIYDPVYLGVPFSPICKLQLENVTTELLTEENELQEKLVKYISYSQKFIESLPLEHDNFISYWENTNHSNKKYSIFILNDSRIAKNNAIVDGIARITGNTKNNNSFFILSDNDTKKDAFSIFNFDFVVENQTPFYNDLKIDLEYNKAKENLVKNLSLIKSKEAQKTIVLESHNIKDGIKIPIGTLLNNNKQHNFMFGEGTENYHAIIGGQSGKGKSVLLNTIIKNGMNKYRNDELRFMLFDCKGIDFAEYVENSYIIESVSTANIPTIIEKLKLIEQEFESRRELFKKHNAKKIEDLLEKGVAVYRLICIVDEFQFLFQGDYKTSQYAEDLLVSKIIRTGRSFGIHLIVATQSLGDSVRRSIIDNIPLRIALGMTEAQSTNFLSFKNDAAKNLNRGVAVYNDGNGEKEFNKIIQIEKVD